MKKIIPANGFYLVNELRFKNKITAFIKASELNTDVKWYYFNNIFQESIEKIDHIHSADINLKELYRQRAQQLRDQYDYLILNYSGGADSHNILSVFLDNNIKLDHIYVQWPMRLMDRGLYTPDSVNKSNANFHSEWDLVLKKDLEWLSQTHPEIKIEIADWLDNVNEKFYNDKIFENSVSNLPSIARSIKQNTFSTTETDLSLKGKRVASIFGVDKPTPIKQGDTWYMRFSDTGFMAQPNPHNPDGLEYFYITPEFPELSILQAKKLVGWIRQNPEKEYLFLHREDRVQRQPEFVNFSHQQHMMEFNERSEICKLVCYPYWNFNRFQADKPFSVLEGLPMGVRQWDNILTFMPNWDRAQSAWEYHWSSYLEKIDMRLMRSKDTVSVIYSKSMKIS